MAETMSSDTLNHHIAPWEQLRARLQPVMGWCRAMLQADEFIAARIEQATLVRVRHLPGSASCRIPPHSAAALRCSMATRRSWANLTPQETC